MRGGKERKSGGEEKREREDEGERKGIQKLIRNSYVTMRKRR